MESRYLYQTFDLPKTTEGSEQRYFGEFDPPKGYRLFRGKVVRAVSVVLEVSK